jgi:3-deoxy-D-manno-octulosonate 8-phosphate phosphatase (KDO 8-P phosphatase)
MSGSRSFKDKAGDIRLLVLDVDGVLTDGKLYLGVTEELKAYSARDGLGITLARSAGLQIAIITGRKSESVSRRAVELRIDHLIQGHADKLAACNTLLGDLKLDLKNVCFVGDDLIDLTLLKKCGLACCPADACSQVIDCADFVSQKNGGAGAVREIIEELLHARGELDQLIKRYSTTEGEASVAGRQ